MNAHDRKRKFVLIVSTALFILIIYMWWQFTRSTYSPPAGRDDFFSEAMNSYREKLQPVQGESPDSKDLQTQEMVVPVIHDSGLNAATTSAVHFVSTTTVR